MDKNIDGLLSRLDDEIDKKCFEIKQRSRNRKLQSVFVIVCALFILVPVLLVLTGISLWIFCGPAILFFVIGFCALSPLIFSRQPGGME